MWSGIVIKIITVLLNGLLTGNQQFYFRFSAHSLLPRNTWRSNCRGPSILKVSCCLYDNKTRKRRESTYDGDFIHCKFFSGKINSSFLTIDIPYETVDLNGCAKTKNQDVRLFSSAFFYKNYNAPKRAVTRRPKSVWTVLSRVELFSEDKSSVTVPFTARRKNEVVLTVLLSFWTAYALFVLTYINPLFSTVSSVFCAEG